MSSENWCVSYTVGPPAEPTTPARLHRGSAAADAADSFAPHDIALPQADVGLGVVVVDMELLTSVMSAPSMSSENVMSVETPAVDRVAPGGEMSSRLSQSPPQTESLSSENSGFFLFAVGCCSGCGSGSADCWNAVGARASEGHERRASLDAEDVTLAVEVNEDEDEAEELEEGDAAALEVEVDAVEALEIEPTRARLWLLASLAFTLATVAVAAATATAARLTAVDEDEDAAALPLRLDTRRRGNGVRGI